MESTRSEDFQPLQIITIALMIGLALFAVVVAYLIISGSRMEPEVIISPQGDVLLVAGFALLCLTMSRFLSSKFLASTPKDERQNYPSAIMAYRRSIIIRMALLEAAGLLACIVAMLTNNVNLLLVTIFMVAMMWLARPSETEFAEWRG